MATKFLGWLKDQLLDEWTGGRCFIEDGEFMGLSKKFSLFYFILFYWLKRGPHSKYFRLWATCDLFCYYLLIWERERERERERWGERFVIPLTDAFIHCLIFVSSLTGGSNNNFGVSGWCSNQWSYMARAWISFPKGILRFRRDKVCRYKCL